MKENEVIEEKNLQEPDESQDDQGYWKEVEPEPESYAFEVKTNLRIQICNLPLWA